MANGDRQKYCAACGKMVHVYTMLSGGGELDRCQVCDTPITEEGSPSRKINLGRIYVVEDTQLLREMIKDIVLVQGLAEEVKGCKNGADFLSRFTRDLVAKKPPGLVMLDVVMPVLNGINAAVAMRAVEHGFGKDPVPILFFTVKQCDDTLKKVMQFCSPALYINKGSDASPDKMHARVEAVVAHLWKDMMEGA